MDSFGTRDLRNLLDSQHANPCVSIYLPRYLSNPESGQDSLRLKNLLNEAEARLAQHWLRSSESRQFLEQARELMSSGSFWQDRLEGIALFISPDKTMSYRLPACFDERMIVGERFHVRPLLPLLNRQRVYFVLAVSQNQVRLFRATEDTIEEVAVPKLPKNMKEELNYAGADRGSQVHSAMHGSHGKQAAVFHGQGGQPDTKKEDQVQYFRAIEAAIEPVLRDERGPLVLAGVSYLLTLLRSVISYKWTLAAELTGNCDYLEPAEIRTRAWQVAAPAFEEHFKKAIDEYQCLAGTGKASNNLVELVPAAHHGRIDKLFVDWHALRWGKYDPEADRVTLHAVAEPHDDELLDLATQEAFLHRGTVFAVEPSQLPTPEPVAAVFRY